MTVGADDGTRSQTGSSLKLLRELLARKIKQGPALDNFCNYCCRFRKPTMNVAKKDRFRTIVFSIVICPFLSATAASAQSPQSGAAAPPEKLDNVNTAVVAARADTKNKRFADAEALMLKLTQDKPQLVIPWVELGFAQLGLKKYSEAETSFKTALGIDRSRNSADTPTTSTSRRRART